MGFDTKSKKKLIDGEYSRQTLNGYEYKTLNCEYKLEPTKEEEEISIRLKKK